MAIDYGSRPPRVPAKDPNSTVVYGMEWAKYLQSNELVTSEWFVVPADEMEVVEHSMDAATKKTSVLVSGGVDQRRYTLTNRITFQEAGGGGAVQTDDRSMIVPVRNL